MHPQYLYIAREHGHPDELKIGQTTRAPSTRRPGLRGQANTDFKMLRVYSTRDAVLAERLAKSALDALGTRIDPAGRRELFKVELSQAELICVRAARQADRLTATQPDRLATSAPVRHRLSTPKPFWAEMLRLPVRFEGKLATLGDLMAAALECAPAARRLEQLGIVCVAFRATRPEFRIDWSNAALRGWRAQRGLAALHFSNEFEQVVFRRTAR